MMMNILNAFFSFLSKSTLNFFCVAFGTFSCLKAEAKHINGVEKTSMMIIRNFYLLLYVFNKLDGIHYKHDNIDGLLNECVCLMFIVFFLQLLYDGFESVFTMEVLMDRI